MTATEWATVRRSEQQRLSGQYARAVCSGRLALMSRLTTGESGRRHATKDAGGGARNLQLPLRRHPDPTRDPRTASTFSAAARHAGVHGRRRGIEGIPYYLLRVL